MEPAPETRASIAAVRARQFSPEPTFIGPAAGSFSNSKHVPSKPAASPQPSRLKRHSRQAFLGLSSVLLVSGGAVVWSLRPVRPAAVGPNSGATTIAVLPFGYQGNRELAFVGEGMVDLLRANLNGAGEIRTVDPHVVLPLVRQTGEHASQLEQGRKVGARLRAGAFVLGSVVEAGGRLRITARLYGVPRPDEIPVLASVQGAPTQLFQLVDELTSKLIAGRSGGPSASLSRLAALTTDSLAALKAYLEGERHFRAGRQDSTIQALERAIRIDSSFALAHYRMATAAMWTNRRPRAGEAVDRALRVAHRLSDRDRRLIGALSASLHGRIAEAERIYREIVTRYPDDLEANYQLGDLIFHRHTSLGRSWLDAREPFERVLAIDPGHQGALYHLSNIAARERKLGELDSLTERVLQIVPPPAWGFRGQRAVAFGDTAEVTRFVTGMRKYSDDLAQPTAGLVVFTTGDLVVGRRIWRMLAEPSRSRGVRVLAHITLAKMEVMTGRWGAAKGELQAAKALDAATALEHRALLSLWPLLEVPRSELLALRTSLLEWKAAPGPVDESGISAEHSRAHPYLRLHLLGLLSSRLGEHAQALQYSGELERQARASFAPSFVGDMARALRAEVARARGRPEEALATLDSVGFWTREDLELTGSSPFYAHEYEQFARAELLDTLGRYEEALRSYRAIADELFHSGAPAHLRMAQIYERQGERQRAAAHYARFVKLWKDCDPELRPLVVEAQRRMAR